MTTNNLTNWELQTDAMLSEIDSEKIPKDFRCLTELLRKTSFINKGGCGVAALTMYRFLKKNEPTTKPKIIFLYSSKTDKDAFEKNYAKLLFEYNSSAINDANSKLNHIIPAIHIALELDGELIDAKGTVKADDYSLMQKGISEENLLRAVNTAGWSNLFDRCEFIEKITQHTDINILDIFDDTDLAEKGFKPNYTPIDTLAIYPKLYPSNKNELLQIFKTI